jgi:hypothetical protein
LELTAVGVLREFLFYQLNVIRNNQVTERKNPDSKAECCCLGEFRANSYRKIVVVFFFRIRFELK